GHQNVGRVRWGAGSVHLERIGEHSAGLGILGNTLATIVIVGWDGALDRTALQEGWRRGRRKGGRELRNAGVGVVEIDHEPSESLLGWRASAALRVRPSARLAKPWTSGSSATASDRVQVDLVIAGPPHIDAQASSHRCPI